MQLPVSGKVTKLYFCQFTKTSEPLSYSVSRTVCCFPPKRDYRCPLSLTSLRGAILPLLHLLTSPSLKHLVFKLHPLRFNTTCPFCRRKGFFFFFTESIRQRVFGHNQFIKVQAVNVTPSDLVHAETLWDKTLWQCCSCLYLSHLVFKLCVVGIQW